jgi:hypothetical protein
MFYRQMDVAIELFEHLVVDKLFKIITLWISYQPEH